jgi:hypothetical protein
MRHRLQRCPLEHSSLPRGQHAFVSLQCIATGVTTAPGELPRYFLQADFDWGRALSTLCPVGVGLGGTKGQHFGRGDGSAGFRPLFAGWMMATPGGTARSIRD